MGVWNLGDLGDLGRSGKVECQAYIYPRLAEKKTHDTPGYQYTILKTHESPFKKGAISKGKDRFLKFAIFQGDMWMFFGGVFVGV